MYPVLANDGIALRPAIQFDKRMKQNIGLEFSVDLDYVKENPFLLKETLQKFLVRQALVTSVTTIDNKFSLPVAVQYVGKSGKTGKNMEDLFTNQVKLLQICQNCLKRCKTNDLIIDKDQHELCASKCERCYDLEAVCESCIPLGHKSYILSVRACEYCLSNGVKCIRRVVMVLTVDREEGNKQGLLQLKDALEKGSIDPDLHLLSIIPDYPHVLKACKASFANWYLQFSNERGCLSIFYTLCNKSESVVIDKIQQPY